MNKWELARYILDAKKSVDSVLYLCSHAEELSMIDLRSEVNEIKRKFYVNGCIVLDKCFPKNKKDICKDTTIKSIYYERDKNYAHKDDDYKLKEYATMDEIADEMGISVEKVREILKIAQEPVSLETPIGEEEDSHLGDFIPDEDAPAPAEAAAFSMLKEQLVDVLGTLTEREQKVLKLRFGLEDGRARTLEEVGKKFDVTRERIRQIEAKALRKLRHPTRSKKLKDYLE